MRQVVKLSLVLVVPVPNGSAAVVDSAAVGAALVVVNAAVAVGAALVVDTAAVGAALVVVDAAAVDAAFVVAVVPAEVVAVKRRGACNNCTPPIAESPLALATQYAEPGGSDWPVTLSDTLKRLVLLREGPVTSQRTSARLQIEQLSSGSELAKAKTVKLTGAAAAAATWSSEAVGVGRSTCSGKKSCGGIAEKDQAVTSCAASVALTFLSLFTAKSSPTSLESRQHKPLLPQASGQAAKSNSSTKSGTHEVLQGCHRRGGKSEEEKSVTHHDRTKSS